MERWIGRVALVTGASRGIGAGIVRTLVKKGMKVVGCSVDVEEIQKIAEELVGETGSLLPIKCNLRNVGEILEMFKTVKANPDFGGVDVCINNAGCVFHATLESGDEEQWRAMLEVNVLALSVCTREALKSMKERNVDDGHIIHINSLSGHRIVPQAKVQFYCATKHAVTALTEGLRQELRAMKTNIRVTSISPGLVDTPVHEPHIRESFPKDLILLQPTDLADAVVYALGCPPHVQIHDLLIRPTNQAS